MNTVNFHGGRAFYQSSADATTNGWYFMTRGDHTHGPYRTRGGMRNALRVFIKACVAAGETGGRRSRRESAASPA